MSTRSAEVITLVTKLLREAGEAGSLKMPPDTQLIVIVRCQEPEAGEEMVSESVVRLNCDACEAAHIMHHLVDEHVNTHHTPGDGTLH